MHLSQLFIHPMKSSRGIDSQQATVTPRGFLHDREWLLASPDGQFITGREQPSLVKVDIAPDSHGALFQAPGQAPLTVRKNDFANAVNTTVWSDHFTAWHGDTAADAWFSAYLGQPCQLLWLGEQSSRQQHDGHEGTLSFADGYPYLLINRASLNDLNSQLAQPVSTRHFRPNLVVDADFPWEEDEWKRVRIGEVEFELTKPCSRCQFTTVDPDSGVTNPTGEPMLTLMRTRQLDEGVCFGINLVALNSGTVQVGDVVCCYTDHVRTGRTSVTLSIEVWAMRQGQGDRVKVTDATFTFVAVDEHGRPQPLPAMPERDVS